MNEVAANEDALTITRGADAPCSMRWEEVRSIGCYQIGDVACVDFNCATGGYLTADSAMRGFSRLMKMLDVYLAITLPEWRERIASIPAGAMLELYNRPEIATPSADARWKERLARPEFPRAAKYDAQWLIDNVMSLHPLWLAEWLTESLELKPGMRVLDLGCGRAASSIFLAREFDVLVWAADAWVKPTDNALRIEEAGAAERVLPIYAEAHALPFAHDYFDAIVSVDAYHYFGTDDLYLGYITQFLRPGGKLGIAVPSVKAEIAGEVPPHLRPYWQADFCSFHSTAWWRRHWEKTGLMKVETADDLADATELWREWSEACAAHGPLSWKEAMAKEAEMLRADAGETFGFSRIVARKR